MAKSELTRDQRKLIGMWNYRFFVVGGFGCLAAAITLASFGRVYFPTILVGLSVWFFRLMYLSALPELPESPPSP